MTWSTAGNEQAPDNPETPPEELHGTPPGGMPPVNLEDEPPIDPLADTSPSQVMRPVSLDDAPDELPMWRRALGLALVLLAAALTIIAGLIAGLPLLRGTAATPAAPVQAAAATPTGAPPTVVAQGGLLLVAEPTLGPEQIAALLSRPPVDLSAAAGPLERRDSAFTVVPERPRAEVITYTIQEGDTITAIAERYGLEKDTIAWSNDRNVVFALRPGNELYILPVDGVYHRALVDETVQAIADKYNVDPYDIINSEYNNLFGATPDTIVRSGTYVVVPGGTSTYNDWTYNPVVERSGGGGGSAGAGYISFAPGQPGSCGRQPNPGGTGYFARPLASYAWVRGFTAFHTGVDLSAAPGASVYAASPGRVIYRGWNDWGYGYLVVLAHGPFTSFYGHLSRIDVGCGQMVPAGGLIGGVGSTGNSSGSHLHFEIRYNDIPTDPLLYVGF